MKKIILLLIILTTLTNISYASFPIPVQPLISVDTIIPDANKVVKQETTEEYHLKIEKQGFDIDNCMCESCRDGIAVKQSKTLTSRSSNSLYNTAAILFTLALIVFLVWMLDGVACINDVSTCSSSNTPLIVYISLLMIFGYSSIFYFIKGLLAQKKDR
tara:strand:+ start:92 stop:568 length:477 start_codon:yes stop_codon:yes gene_type:complete